MNMKYFVVSIPIEDPWPMNQEQINISQSKKFKRFSKCSFCLLKPVQRMSKKEENRGRSKR